jgi:hypothetical protein
MSEEQAKIKFGMWRLTGGRIACVDYECPHWQIKDLGYVYSGWCPDGAKLFRVGWSHDNTTSDGPAFTLAEFLSPEIADPRTWKPPVILKPGMWQSTDGDIRYVRHSRGIIWEAHGPTGGFYTCYRDGTACRTDVKVPPLVEYLGPDPFDPKTYAKGGDS